MELFNNIKDVFLVMLSIYSIWLTRSNVLLKSKLDVTTTNEKWFAGEQNESLIKLSKDIFSIISKLKSFPEYGGIPIGLASKFYSQIMNELSTHKLNLAYITILFDDRKLFEIIEDYYKVLEELSNHKREIFEKLEEFDRKAQISNSEMPEDLYLEGFREGDFCMQPTDFFKTRADYFKMFEEKVYGVEYMVFSEQIKNFLKSVKR